MSSVMVPPPRSNAVGPQPDPVALDDAARKTRKFEDGLALTFLTFGIYYFVWYFRLNDQLKRVGAAVGDPALARSRPDNSLAAVVFGLSVLPPLISIYGFCRRIERAQTLVGIPSDARISPAAAFLLWFPAGLLIVPLVIHCWYVTKHQNALLLALGSPAAVEDVRVDRADAVAVPAPAPHPAPPPAGAHAPAARGAHAEIDTAPTFRVVALGPSGSGKTVFLASMFHRLNFSDEERPYKLEADFEQLIALGQLYDELSDTEQQSWPAGTDETLREFRFDCVASDPKAPRKPILRLSYLDYRGGLLTHGAEPGSTALVELESRIQTAHALLAVIDGFRVRQMLRDEPTGHAYFERRVRPMFALMEQAACPIHFVVTKWDLVRDIGEAEHLDDSLSLEQVRVRLVRDALMAYGHIKAIVYKNSNQIVRLIPVSAVGPRFGTLDAEGNVVKLRDGRLSPTNVEVPLSAVLPDLFAQVEQRLDEPVKEAIRSERRDRQHQQALRVAAGALAAVLGGLGGFGISPRFVANDVLPLFVGWLGGTSTASSARNKRPGKKPDERLVEAQARRAAVMNDFRKTVQKMERALPDSVLSAGP